MNRISPKQKAKREADGERVIFSTIRPKKDGPPSRRSPVKRRNPKRKASEFTRAYGSETRVEWIKRQRCVITGLHSSAVENVHVRGGGASRKADACWIVPMISELHKELHRVGKQSFEAKYEIDLDAAAAWTESRWRRHQERSA